MFEALYRCYWSEFESRLLEEDMEFETKPPTIALNKLKAAFDVEKVRIELPNIYDKLQGNNCSVCFPFFFLFVSFLFLFLQDLSLLLKLLNFLSEKT